MRIKITLVSIVGLLRWKCEVDSVIHFFWADNVLVPSDRQSPPPTCQHGHNLESEEKLKFYSYIVWSTCNLKLTKKKLTTELALFLPLFFCEWELFRHAAERAKSRQVCSLELITTGSRKNFYSDWTESFKRMWNQGFGLNSRSHVKEWKGNCLVCRNN